MTTPDNSGLSAALLQITKCAERLALLEQRVTDNLTECQISAAGTGDAITDLRAVVVEQGKLLESVNDLIKTLVPPPDGPGPKPYEIQPSIHWWSIKDTERAKALDHLRGWVDHVYRPHYGHLAGMLAPCWADHELCLIHLDWLSELHSALYFNKRTQALLNAQAEYHVRILPASVELMKAETARCPHREAAANGSELARCPGEHRQGDAGLSGPCARSPPGRPRGSRARDGRPVERHSPASCQRQARTA